MCAAVAGAEAPEQRAPLSKELQRSFANVILQLASKAQYSKASLTRVAANCVADQRLCKKKPLELAFCAAWSDIGLYFCVNMFKVVC